MKLNVALCSSPAQDIDIDRSGDQLEDSVG